MTDRPVVLYHQDCADGFTAAWVARLALPDADPSFIPVQYGRPVPEEALSGRGVYVLDFSYPEADMEEMASRARFLVCLDHHKTARDDLEAMSKKYDINEAHVLVRFDTGKSGARLAWEHFHPASAGDPPPLVLYVEDRDIWSWRLPFSREINAYVRSWPMDFETWDALDATLRDGPLDADHTAVREGRAVLRYQDRVVEDQVKNASTVNIAGCDVPCVNATVLISEITGRLAAGRPFAATFFERSDGKRVYSLRSGPDGVDVGEVARLYGGGGHRHAAGFELSPGHPL